MLRIVIFLCFIFYDLYSNKTYKIAPQLHKFLEKDEHERLHCLVGSYYCSFSKCIFCQWSYMVATFNWHSITSYIAINYSFWSVVILKCAIRHEKFLFLEYVNLQKESDSVDLSVSFHTDMLTMISCCKFNITFSISILSIEVTDKTLKCLPTPPNLTGFGLKHCFQIAVSTKDRLMWANLHTSSSCFFKSRISLRYLFRRASSSSTSLTFGLFFILLAVLANWKNILSWAIVREQIYQKTYSVSYFPMELTGQFMR